jgi:hypothetical protein
MMAADRQKYDAFMREHVGGQGKRCAKARSNEDGDVVACAIAMTVLNLLHHASETKAVSRHDLKTAMAAFLEAAGMEEYDLPMGGTAFRRKTA